MNIKNILLKIVPKIEELPECWRIVWLGYERLIEKNF